MNVVGHYLLFSPIIALFAWIPFVGWLLAGFIKIVAYVVAFLWGSMVHILVLAVAWIFYRPLYGILLLSVVVGGIVLLSIDFSGSS